MQKDSVTGTLGALIANAIFGLSYYFSQMALDTGIHPLVILQVRFTLAFAALSLLAALRVIRIRYKGKPLGRLLLMAVMQPLLYFIFELYGIARTSTALSGVIIGMTPAVVMAASALILGERPTALQWGAGLVSVGCITAISLIGKQNGSTDWLGILLLVGAVVTAAGFNLLSRSVATQFSAWERTYAMFAVAAAAFLVITPAALRGQYRSQLTLAAGQPRFWLALLYLSLLSSIAAYFLYNHATGRIGLVRASAFSGVITVVSMFTGIFILKEPMTPVQIVLCLLIIACIYVVNCPTPAKA